MSAKVLEMPVRNHIEFVDCGHRKTGWSLTDHRGYIWCPSCAEADARSALASCNRVVLVLHVPRGVSPTGCTMQVPTVRFPVSGELAGTVLERVVNDNARTPTGGRYTSDRMTIRDIYGGTWYANAPRSGNRIILRRK